MKRLAILGAFVLAGCPSFTTMGTARTVPRDTTQTWIAPEFVGFTTEVGDPPERQSLSIPQFEFGVRRGITDGVELGGRIWLLGAALESKFQLVRSETQDRGIDIALAPSVGWLGFNTDSGDFNVITLYLSLPIGINVPGGSQLVLTPKAIGQQYIAKDSGSSADTATVIFVGGSVGYAWKLGTMYILPEISIMQPAVQDKTGTPIFFDGAFFQGGVGFLFGG